MERQMTPEEALTLLDRAAQVVQGSRADHVALLQAFSTLDALLKSLKEASEKARPEVG